MIVKRIIFKFALLLAVLVISYLVFSRPNYSPSVPHLDKIGHLSGFFCLSLLTYLAFKPKWPILLMIMAGYALLIEIVQSYLPYRSAEFGDWIADMSGVVLFYLSLWLYQLFSPAPKSIES
ncbi:MAG: VanZ family protein [Shewanella sp.]|uniref:VanZ family protein n=1 Tax=Shewanella sp. SNU WT4 TaxID=2590015 RepID=UPI001127BE38|nr:VanZ family protein [Shewanella sp. SNU WT4]QDF67907.1 VanZ family protein [Shewanella sp. SNU WT4]